MKATSFLCCLMLSGGLLSMRANSVGAEPARLEAPGLQVDLGPWGEMESYPIVLEPSEDYASRASDLYTWQQGTVWRFLGNTAADVGAILLETGLDPALVAKLTQEPYFSKNELHQCLEVRPPDDVILNLTSEQRVSMYSRIYSLDENSVFNRPFTLTAKFDETIKLVPPVGLEAPAEQILQMSYWVGRSRRFADINYVFERLPNDAARRRVIKFVSRERSFQVRLRLTEDTDVEELTDYWGGSGRNKDISPLLESTVGAPGVDWIDLVHLLPPTPRKLLHTYPNGGQETVGAELPDCFWTACSFFSNNPPQRLLDRVGHVIDERYEKVPQPLQFGDLIMISNPVTGEAIHACNYLAGTMVFTKNGRSLGRPWVVAPIGDIIDAYLKDVSVNVAFYRLKPQYQQ